MVGEDREAAGCGLMWAGLAVAARSAPGDLAPISPVKDISHHPHTGSMNGDLPKYSSIQINHPPAASLPPIIPGPSHHQTPSKPQIVPTQI